jgi:hypothetical protein
MVALCAGAGVGVAAMSKNASPRTLRADEAAGDLNAGTGVDRRDAVRERCYVPVGVMWR